MSENVRKLSNDVALGRIFANEKLGKLKHAASVLRLYSRTDTGTYSEAGREDAAALLDGASDLGRGLPHNLGEVRWDGVVRVVLS